MAMKFRVLFLVILFMSMATIVRSQKLTIVPYGKLQCGYGSFRGYTELDHNFFTAGTDPGRSTYSIFNGVDYSFILGGSFLRSGNDIYRESYFDIFLVHKRISGSSNGAGFTGIGVQCRYRFFYIGFVLGMAGNRNELPIVFDDNNNPQIFGDLHGATPMFVMGLRAPLNSEHTLFLDIPFDFVIPRNRGNNEPVGDAAIYEWYSFSIGICYNLWGLGSDH